MRSIGQKEAARIIAGNIKWLEKNLWRCKDAIVSIINESKNFEDVFDVSTASLGFLVGRAWGIREERARRQTTKPAQVVDTIMNSDEPFSCGYAKMTPRGRKAYRRAADAVKRVHGNWDALAVSVSEVEAAAYRQGFAAAMQLMKECEVQP